MEIEKHIQEIFEEAMEQKNISYEKLAILTGIPEKYVVAIQNMELKRLPASPYIRGYLKKICEPLGLDFPAVWKQYQLDLAYKTSGAFDKLPVNRFAIQKINRKSIAVVFVCVVLLVFLGVNFNNFFGKPYLQITNPGENITSVSEAAIILSGRINPSDKLTVNGRDVAADSSGNFETSYELQPGLNTIVFKSKKILGKENSEIRQVILEQAPAEITY